VTASGAETLSPVAPLADHVRLLPAFDAYVFAPKGHRRHAWPEGLHHRISRTAGWITPALVVNGRVAGVWGYERRADSVAVEIEPPPRLLTLLHVTKHLLFPEKNEQIAGMKLLLGVGVWLNLAVGVADCQRIRPSTGFLHRLVYQS
jgi:hypothetical protein